MGKRQRDRDVLDAITAARELADAACYLADVAGRLAREDARPETHGAGLMSVEASVRAAQAAFSLDQIIHTDMDEPSRLWLTADAIAVAQDAIELAREAIDASLPATFTLPAPLGTP